MKKLFLSVATIALTLASCSNDEVINLPETSDGIEFRTLMDKPSSGLRAAITDETSLLSFTVTGIKQSNTDYLFDGFGITKGENASWDYTPKRYWPKNDKVDFYAYSPSSSKNVSNGITGYQTNDLITYTVPQISKKDAQEDFLVARIKDMDASPVTLNFHHALSRVMFFAKTTQKNVTYTIDKIELINLYETGDLTLDATEIEEGSALVYNTTTALQPWIQKGNKVNYTVDLGQSPIYMLTDFASVLGETNAVMILPQKTALATTGSTPPVSGEFAIKVSYKAFVDDIYYAGTATDSEVKYFAVNDPIFTPAPGDGITFEMGRQYNFYLEFGDEVGDAISFEVAVSDWTNAPAIYIPEIDDYSILLSADLMAKVTDANGNGKIDKAEIEAVTSLTANTATFDFKGLEYFAKLEELIITGVTNGANLDASKNKLLTEVTISGSTLGTVNLSNSELTTLTLSGNNTFTLLNASDNKLSNIDLGTGTTIGDLDLSGNATLTSIDLTDATVVGTLDLSNCAIATATIERAKIGVNVSSNPITLFDGGLILSSNKFTTLTLKDSKVSTLDISNNATLTKYTLTSSGPAAFCTIGRIDATKNTVLESAHIDGPNNASQYVIIQEIDIRNSASSFTQNDAHNAGYANIEKLILWDISWADAKLILSGYSGVVYPPGTVKVYAAQSDGTLTYLGSKTGSSTNP